jgi:hypothetical protein
MASAPRRIDQIVAGHGPEATLPREGSVIFALSSFSFKSEIILIRCLTYLQLLGRIRLLSLFKDALPIVVHLEVPVLLGNIY